jgi:cell division protein FtsI/penicillin-binding protein 2
VVTVLVEFGGGGGATAAPVAGRIFEKFLELEKR